MAHIPHVRLSPINGIGVQWSNNGQDFKADGLPTSDHKVKPFCGCPTPLITKHVHECPVELPVELTVDTYDWSRFLSEVIVGIDDSDEEIAASYIREAAIEFCHTAKVLIRDVVLPIQRGENKFILEPFDFERIDGISHVMSEDGCRCTCHGFKGHHNRGLKYEFNSATNMLTVTDERLNCTQRLLHVRMWTTPTEDACAYDVVLYENYRRTIATIARVRYVKAVHYKDRPLVMSLPKEAELDRLMLMAKGQAIQHPYSKTKISSLFGG